MEDLKTKLVDSFWGYTKKASALKVDKDLLNLYKYLSSLDLSVKAKKTNLSVEDIVLSSAAFYSEHFDVLPILHIDEKTKDKICADFTDNNMSVSLVTSIINKHSTLISPFELPIMPRTGGHLGALNSVTFLSGDTVNAYKIPVGYNVVALEYPFTSLTPIAYTHEIAHTQMGVNKGKNLKDYHNSEVISIFLEKLHAYETDPKLFLEIEKDRLQEVKYLIGSLYVPLDSRKKHANKMSAFIVSSLIADNLFNMYLEASYEGKKLLLSYIQMVINGEIFLEDMLEMLEIDFERSKNPEFIEANLRV